MEANQVTKTCTHCGRTLPLSNFGLLRGKPRAWCKECINNYNKIHYNKNKTYEANPALKEFTPQQLIAELRFRGYTGELTFVETKVHKIKL